MKFAAIDIGTNAVRLLIKEVTQVNGKLNVRKVSFTRVSLRLGEDVFETGKISNVKARNLVKVMRAFWYLMDVYEIEWFKAYATSAMREAKNKNSVCSLVKREANIDIELIDGDDEADLIFRNYNQASLGPDANYLYIDVGGGSLELTLIREGKRVRGQSFDIGSLRFIKGAIPDGEWEAVEEFVKHVSDEKRPLIAIGTGGNINRLQKLIGNPKNNPISISKLDDIRIKLESYSFEERVEIFSLKPDRADIIVPAARMYVRVMKLAGADKIIIPKLGLTDGIILKTYEEFIAHQESNK